MIFLSIDEIATIKKLTLGYKQTPTSQSHDFSVITTTTTTTTYTMTYYKLINLRVVKI